MKPQTIPTDLSASALESFEQVVASRENCFLFETLADKDQPQTTTQSYIGVAPDRCYSAKEDKFYVDGKEQQVGNPYEALSKQIDINNQLPAGYIGGLVGYFSHEAIHYIEPSLSFNYPREFYDFKFGHYNDGLIFRHGQSPEYFYYGQNRLDLYRARAKNSSKLSIDFLAEAKDADQYAAMIDKARQDIINGRVFQVVLANRYDYHFSGDLLELYKELRRINPSPFMFFMKFGNIITLGASPEMLVHTSASGQVSLEALAGTIRRGENDSEDAALASTMLNDEKEIAEHNMLVDLARNDIGRVSSIGSVKIDDLMYIKKLSHVQHLSSLVSGQLRVGHDGFDALSAVFPAGTLTGAPKIEAIKMISELEGYERGPYGGSVGYFSYSGDSVHAVNIRSVSAVNSKLLLHSGSGIVYDSIPAREYQEIAEKKAAMNRAIGPFLREEAK